MKNIDIFVRIMTEADVVPVANLSLQLGYPSTVEDIKNRWLQISSSNSESVYILTSANQEVIGFAHVGVELGLTTSSRSILRSFIVDEKLRGQGLGTKFLFMVEDKMKTRGFPKIRVGSQTKRADAHRFYQRAGYELLKVWNVFEKDLNQI